jgi:hypothetical protein
MVMAVRVEPRSIDPIPIRVVDYLEPAFAHLDEFAGLDRDWDSYGADPISGTAIKVARGMLILSADHIGRSFDPAIRPHVAPLADGGVQIEWRAGERALDVEIQADGTLGYLYVERFDGTQRDDDRDEVSVDDILRLLDTLVAQPHASAGRSHLAM